MLRHACAFKPANDGVDTRSRQAYLGHRNIQNTTRYAPFGPDQFKGFGGTNYRERTQIFATDAKAAACWLVRVF